MLRPCLTLAHAGLQLLFTLTCRESRIFTPTYSHKLTHTHAPPPHPTPGKLVILQFCKSKFMIKNRREHFTKNNRPRMSLSSGTRAMTS